MTTLTLDPAIAAARRAAKAASVVTQPPIAAPEPPAQAPAPSSPGKKAAKKLAMNALQDRLKLMFPHLFATHPPPPLAIGIRDDIARHLAPEEAKLLSDVLRRWCARPAYLKACAEPGAHRVDLAGNLTPVEPEQVAYARAKAKLKPPEQTAAFSAPTHAATP